MVRNDENDRHAISRAIALGASLLVYSKHVPSYSAWNKDLTHYVIIDQDENWVDHVWWYDFDNEEKRYNQLLKYNDVVWELNKMHVKIEDVYVFDPLVSQVGGGHYKDRAIQPIEYIIANNLNFNKGNVVKYISRYEDKGGINDLAKVVHYTLLEAYSQYGEEGSTELALKIKEILNID